MGSSPILDKEGYKSVPTGIDHGVVSAIINGEEYEIATFREDGEYSDGRRPDSVTFSNIDADAKRRDLTINALYYDIINDKIIDLVGGIDDITSKNIRTVGNPIDRFGEDRIRILRAIRFAAINNSSLNSDIEKEILRNNSLSGISKERLKDEFLKGIVKAKSVPYYLSLIDKFNLFDEIFPTLSVNKKFPIYKDPVMVIAILLKNNPINQLRKLLVEKLKYPTNIIDKSIALIAIQTLDDNNAYRLKKIVNSKKVSDDQIQNFLNNNTNISKNVITAFVKYRHTPPLKGDEIAKEYNIEKRELGDKIESLENEVFKSLI